ncbi:MAG: hypothetical protein M3Q45_05310, partial [Chloroflexota bacterium]|nr:hypothetical protein [Chloroflexota bacterium]
MSDYELSTNMTTFRYCCPHLGLAADRTLMLTGATSAHRCYVQLQAFGPDLNHQDEFCLDDNYLQCPFYVPQASAQQPIELVQPPVPPPALAQSQPVQNQMHPLTYMPFEPQTVSRSSAILARPSFRLPSFRLPGWFLPAGGGALGLLGLLLLMTFVPASWNMRSLLATFQRDSQPVHSDVAASMIVNDTTSDAASTIVNSANGADTPTTIENSLTITSAPVAVQLILEPSATPSVTLAAVTLSGERFFTPTPEPGGQVFYLNPNPGNVGWWVSNDPRRAYLGDSFLYAGVLGNDTRVAAAHFDLSSVPRGAPLRQVTLRLTGLRSEGMTTDAQGTWLIQLIGENALKSLGGVDFLTLYSAPASITLQPELAPADLAVDQVNEWTLDANALDWLAQQLLDGARSLTVRILPGSAGTNSLFAWDSGAGSQSNGNPPGLLISIGPPPPTPPALPTRPVVVATLTPVPQNVLTVVAQNLLATGVAQTTGTYTPMPIDVVTPTPFPENLATVQAVAVAQGLPAVVIETPTPASPALATGD